MNEREITEELVNACEALCQGLVRLEIWEPDIDILDTRLIKEYRQGRNAIAQAALYLLLEEDKDE